MRSTLPGFRPLRQALCRSGPSARPVGAAWILSSGAGLSACLKGSALDVDSALRQPYGRQRDVKQVPTLTFSAIAEALTSSGIATGDEVDRVTAELDAFAARADTTISCPRIFQAFGSKARGRSVPTDPRARHSEGS